jgi:hypothetical protein
MIHIGASCTNGITGSIALHIRTTCLINHRTAAQSIQRLGRAIYRSIIARNCAWSTLFGDHYKKFLMFVGMCFEKRLRKLLLQLPNRVTLFFSIGQ